MPMPTPITTTRTDFKVFRFMPTRWADNDHYGHVNNVAYYSYFDSTVNGYLIETTGTDTRAGATIGVVAETSCRFLKELSFPDQLYIGLKVATLSTRSVVFELAVFRGDDVDPAAVGRFAQVYIDVETRRPVAIPAVIRAAIEKL
jgi:acyl-CoA thioester hydrolase